MKAETYLTELAGLRGLAALCVVLYHVGNLTGIRPALIRSGGPTLDLFFLLSGFVLIHQYERRRELQPETDVKTTSRFYFSHFYLRRFFRIAPLFTFCCWHHSSSSRSWRNVTSTSPGIHGYLWTSSGMSHGRILLHT
jgi:peptidoglycan/LPS O-acetylase OafA/YrhL